MEWINGVRLSDAEGVRSSAKNALLERGVRCSLHQLLETGFMHADPHPGNLVVDANTGALTYLDFGMTVTVDARRRSAMLRGRSLRQPRRAPARARPGRARARLADAPTGKRQGADAADGGFRRRGARDEHESRSRDERFPRCRVSARLGAVRVRARLPPYFARRSFGALAALEGVAGTGVDPQFRVIEAKPTHAVGARARELDPGIRETLRRLVLTPMASPCGGAASRASSARSPRAPRTGTGTIPAETLLEPATRRRKKTRARSRRLRNVSQSRRDGARRRGGRRRVVRARARERS